MMQISALVPLLAARTPTLARELLPRGRREGAEWVCPSTASPFGCSVSVHLTGLRSGIWSAKCDVEVIVPLAASAGSLREARELIVGTLIVGR